MLRRRRRRWHRDHEAGAALGAFPGAPWPTPGAQSSPKPGSPPTAAGMAICATWQNFYGKTSDELNETPLGTSENGTGPFKLDHWTPGEEIVLIANEDYWRTEPAWEGGPTGAPALKKDHHEVDRRVQHPLCDAAGWRCRYCRYRWLGGLAADGHPGRRGVPADDR